MFWIISHEIKTLMLGYDAILINRLIIKFSRASNPTYHYQLPIPNYQFTIYNLQFRQNFR
jgi:hypothetical protein